MKTFMDYYRERMERNHETFLQLAKELKEQGCDVYATKSGLINFIHVVKGMLQCTLEFDEVPYRWVIRYDINPKEKNGSSRTAREVHGTENPFTPDDIIEAMRPIYGSKEQYIKGLSFLKKYEL